MEAKRAKLSEQVREAITASTFSKAEICQRSGIDKAQLSRFMHGQAGLSTKCLDAIGELLGLAITTASKRRGKR